MKTIFDFFIWQVMPVSRCTNMSMYSMWTKDKIFIIGSFLASVHRERKRELACVQNALDKQMETCKLSPADYWTDSLVFVRHFP